VVRRPASLHHHEIHFTVVEPTLELRTGETGTLEDLPVHIGQCELEDVLCQIDSDGSSIHFGLLLFWGFADATPHDVSAWHDDAV
jgi:hypothetical protein